jgi:hypothetical protein
MVPIFRSVFENVCTAASRRFPKNRQPIGVKKTMITIFFTARHLIVPNGLPRREAGQLFRMNSCQTVVLLDSPIGTEGKAIRSISLQFHDFVPLNYSSKS